MSERVRVLSGDCRQSLWTVPNGSIQTCVTSPPAWSSPSHLPEGHADRAREIGQQTSPYAYIVELIALFRQVWHALRDDGTLWLRVSDLYRPEGIQGIRGLFGFPWRLASALQANRWILHADLALEHSGGLWGLNEAPAWDLHDHLFLFSKSGRYHCSRTQLPEGPSFEARCVLAGSRPGETVLDCFGGNGETARAAFSGGRPVLVCELSAERARALREEFGIIEGER